MKLASYRTDGSDIVRLAAKSDLPGPASLIDLERAWRLYAEDGPKLVQNGGSSQQDFPSDALSFINGGPQQLARANRALEHCRSRASDETGRREVVARGILRSDAEVRFLPPVPRPGKFISLGVNYPAHMAEASDMPAVQRLKSGPGVPRAFAKFPSSLVGHREPIVYPGATRQLDYEIEMALVIGKRCKNVAPAEARNVIYGYTIYNDLSMRDIQSDEMATGLLLLGKNFDSAGPIGPWLVTADEVSDPDALDLTLTVNGEVRQHDNTRNMLRSVAEVVAYWSQITLEPGDIISTGTPAGVGFFRDPPENFLLRLGDRIVATIEGLGSLENSVVAEKA